MRSDIRPAEGRLFIDEDLDMIGVPTVALARTWFNASTLAEPWLEQGLSMWAGLTVADASCPDPGVAPESAAAGLSDWAEPAGKPPGWDGGRLYYQTAAACTAVERLAEAVGPAGMASALSAFLSAAPTYGSVARTPRGADGRADWRDFLDAIDELGLIPAGEPDLELAERLLVEYGIADEATLSGRASARQIYHDTLASMDGTPMPAYVDTLMGDWAFGDALAGVIDAGRVYRAIAAAARPGESERDALLGAFTSAASPEALEAIEQAVAAAAS
jgi:hypothetical protein